MITELRPDARSDAWRGAAGWEERDGALRAWRLLPELVGRAFAPELLAKAREAAGVRLDVLTDADLLELVADVSIDIDRALRFDVVVDGALHQRVDVEPGRVELSMPLPAGEHRVQVWLPQVGQTWLRSVRLAGSVQPAPAGVRWTTYGSSITQCSGAAGPSETWPAVVARALDWDLTCLGFGGQCHLDPVAARTIAAIPADVVSLCLGINVQGGASLSQRTFGPQVAGLIDEVRVAHPQAPIVVITPIVSPPRERTPNPVGVTLEWMRETITEVVEATGDDRLHLVDGPSIIGYDDVRLLPDELHPDADGYRLMGERLGAVLVSLLG